MFSSAYGYTPGADKVFADQHFEETLEASSMPKISVILGRDRNAGERLINAGIVQSDRNDKRIWHYSI
ncbi:MAG: hypothetical protein PHG00_00180 [Methylococcales bacterium]|nr:hypothetical protein [Methylococcales bacterium]